MWFLIALLGYFLLAVVFILDKLILSKSVESPAVYAFYSTVIMFGVLVALPFGVEMLVGVDWWWAIASGLGFGFGMWAMFIAVKKGEASHINPFIGAVVTIATYLIASVLLAEALTSMQVLGMVMLMAASFMLGLETSKDHEGFHIGYVWAIGAGILFAISHVAAKYIYEIYPFVTGFVWTRATTGLVAFVALLSPHVWKTFRKSKKNKPSKQLFAKKHVIAIVSVDKVLGFAGVIAIQYAISMGSVTMVNAMAGLQYALMFAMIFVLTKLAPKIFKEYFTKKELVVQTAAICLVVVGSALFVL